MISPPPHRARRVILEKTELPFEEQAVLNPGCIEKDGIVHMFYRAVGSDNRSTIGYAQYRNGEIIHRSAEPVLIPDQEYERCGIEDPRVSEIEGTYYLIYIAYDGLNARIAYATSSDLVNFTKHGVISPPLQYKEAVEICNTCGFTAASEYFDRYYLRDQNVLNNIEKLMVYEKDAFLFPRKIGGHFALVHRIFPAVQIVYFDDFSQLQSGDFWRSYLCEINHHTIIEPEHWFESRHVGGGGPPLETPYGWLFVYHAVEETEDGRVYHAALALLDLEDPTRVIAKLEVPFFSPGEAWEKVGDVGNVVFPTATTLHDNIVTVYYGAADSRIATRSFHLSDLLSCLLPGEVVVGEGVVAGEVEWALSL